MAKILNPVELFEVAVKHVRKLSAKERRRVICHLQDYRLDKDTKEFRSNYQLGALFGVSEMTIRNDKRKIQLEFAAQVTPTQAVAFITDQFRSIDRCLRACEKGLDMVEPGTFGHRAYLDQIADLEARRLKVAMDIGLVAKELGHLTVSEECWIATTSAEGVTTVEKHIEPQEDGA